MYGCTRTRARAHTHTHTSETTGAELEPESPVKNITVRPRIGLNHARDDWDRVHDNGVLITEPKPYDKGSQLRNRARRVRTVLLRVTRVSGDGLWRCGARLVVEVCQVELCGDEEVVEGEDLGLHMVLPDKRREGPQPCGEEGKPAARSMAASAVPALAKEEEQERRTCPAHTNPVRRR